MKDTFLENKVPTLTKVVVVQDNDCPVSVFVMKNLPDAPEVVQYVNVDSLPKDLVQSIRQAVQGK